LIIRRNLSLSRNVAFCFLCDATPFCQLDISSTCQFINNLLFHQLFISSTCHFINLSFHQLVISPTCHFINLTFPLLLISSTNYLINLSFHQLLMSSTNVNLLSALKPLYLLSCFCCLSVYIFILKDINIFKLLCHFPQLFVELKVLLNLKKKHF